MGGRETRGERRMGGEGAERGAGGRERGRKEAYICTGDLILPGLNGVVGRGRLVGVFGSSGHGGGGVELRVWA